MRESEDNFDWHLWDGSLRSGMAVHGPDPRYLFLAFARLYLKLSLTGNEGEFIRRYRLDEPVFPHQSTADQFFSETQFEAYRSLGEHVGDKLFLKAIVGEKVSTDKYVEVEEWFNALGQSLLAPLTSPRWARRKRWTAPTPRSFSPPAMDEERP